MENYLAVVVVVVVAIVVVVVRSLSEDIREKRDGEKGRQT